MWEIYARKLVVRFMRGLELRNARILFNVFFFKSQFSYCPLAWMYHSLKLSNKTNALHERCLRFICKDKRSMFQKLLDQGKSASIHNRDLPALAT